MRQWAVEALPGTEWVSSAEDEFALVWKNAPEDPMALWMALHQYGQAGHWYEWLDGLEQSAIDFQSLKVKWWGKKNLKWVLWDGQRPTALAAAEMQGQSQNPSLILHFYPLKKKQIKSAKSIKGQVDLKVLQSAFTKTGTSGRIHKLVPELELQEKSGKVQVFYRSRSGGLRNLQIPDLESGELNISMQKEVQGMLNMWLDSELELCSRAFGEALLGSFSWHAWVPLLHQGGYPKESTINTWIQKGLPNKVKLWEMPLQAPHKKITWWILQDSYMMEIE